MSRRWRCCSTEGEFDTLEEAIACAQGVIDKSLERGRRPGMSATQWYQTYSTGGDGVYLMGGTAHFNPYDYAKARIEAITGERPKDWCEK